MRGKWTTPYEAMKIVYPDDDESIRTYIADFPGLGNWHPEYERLARKEAEQRPGVMIKAEEYGPMQVRSNWCECCGQHDVKRGLGCRNVPRERTCATCSKTCDVGVKCWWCGNE